jgi:hypothetical protein
MSAAAVDVAAAAEDQPMPPAEPTWAERALLERLTRAIDAGNADRKELLELMRTHEKNAGERHAATLAALGKVDEGIDVVAKAADAEAKKPGLFAQISAFLDTMPVVKSAMANALVGIILAGGGYVVFRLTGTPPTPTPIQVAPVTVTAAPSSASTSATSVEAP